MLDKVGPKGVFYPTAVWLVVLFVLFLAEWGVMLILPYVFGAEPSMYVSASIDACAITAILAPIIWWTLVRPIRQVIRQRTQFLGDLFTAIEAERRQTAYELHDGIGQELSLLISGLRSAHSSIDDPEQAARCLALQSLAQKALAEVRRISRGLRPSLLDDVGLAAAVEKLVGDFREHSELDVSLRTDGLDEAKISEKVKTAAFRIVQEALANVVRHSRAKHATIEMRRQESARGHEIVLTIADDGQGFNAKDIFDQSATGKHFGVIGMRERVALLQGRFSIESRPGQGCRIVAILPTTGVSNA